MRHASDVETPVRLTVPKDWNVQHMKISDSRLSRLLSSINAFHDISLKAGEWSYIAHSIPGIEFARWFSFRLVTFEEARHEEFFRQCRQANPARFAILYNPIGFVRIDGHRPRVVAVPAFVGWLPGLAAVSAGGGTAPAGFVGPSKGSRVPGQ